MWFKEAKCGEVACEVGTGVSGSSVCVSVPIGFMCFTALPAFNKWLKIVLVSAALSYMRGYPSKSVSWKNDFVH